MRTNHIYKVRKYWRLMVFPNRTYNLMTGLFAIILTTLSCSKKA
jgi:hypothetical protein